MKFWALSAAALSGIGWSAVSAAPLHLQFNNDSGLANSQVYIGFTGSSISATNTANGSAISNTQYGDTHWYTLDTINKGIDLSGFSGRIYVGYGSPWTFNNAGYEPPPTVATDPNYLKRYDKLELTYFGNAADVADTTAIDYFSIPLQLKVYKGGTSGTLKGTLNASSTETTVAALSKLGGGAAIVRDGNGNFVRAIGPSAYPPSGGLPASPYDNFTGYLNYLRQSYGPSHSGTVATIKGYFGGVGPSPSTNDTKGQNYTFTATIDANDNITLTGGGTAIGGNHTMLFKKQDLSDPTGIYGANPPFYLDGSSTATTPQNNIYGWIVGDLLAGLNIGAVGSTTIVNGVQVGQMDSSAWFALSQRFASLQPSNPYYNQWAAALAPLSDAYNFAYSDRFAPVTAPLDPSQVDTLLIDIGGSVPEPTSIGALLLTCVGLSARRRSNHSQR